MTSKTKTYIIATSSWANGASVPMQSRQIAQELVRRGNRVIVLVGANEALPPQDSNVEVYHWPSRRATHLRDAIFFWRLCRKSKPDLILTMFHATNIMVLVGFLLGVKQRAVYYHTLDSAVMIDLHLHKPNLKIHYQKLRKRIIYKLATAILPISHAASLDVQKNYHVSPNKCYVFLNAVEDPFAQAQSLVEVTPQHQMVRCFARLDPTKGIDILLRAWVKVVESMPDAELEIYGKGQPDAVIQSAGLSQAPPNVHFAGVVKPDEVRRLMRSSTITVLPSRIEAFGFSAVESLSVGTPVVASNAGGIPEIIHHGIDGFLVKPGDPLELAERIKEVLLNPDLRERMSTNARKNFEQNFDLDRTAILQADMLQEMVKAD